MKYLYTEDHNSKKKQIVDYISNLFHTNKIKLLEDRNLQKEYNLLISNNGIEMIKRDIAADLQSFINMYPEIKFTFNIDIMNTKCLERKGGWVVPLSYSYINK